jgi:hypothetical protein
MFVGRDPERVAGVVFLDALDNGALDRLTCVVNSSERRASLAETAARFGIRSVCGGGEADTAGRALAPTSHVKAWRTRCARLRGIPASADQLMS